MSHLEQVLSLAFCSFYKSLSEQGFEAFCQNIISQLPRGGWKCDCENCQKGARLVCVREAEEKPILLLDFNGGEVRGQVQMENAPASLAERIRKHNAYLSEFVRTFLPGEEEGLIVDSPPSGGEYIGWNHRRTPGLVQEGRHFPEWLQHIRYRMLQQPAFCSGPK